MRYLLFGAMALSVLITACSKDNNPNTPTTPKKYLFHYLSGGDSAIYNWDDGKLVTIEGHVASVSVVFHGKIEYKDGKMSTVYVGATENPTTLSFTVLYDNAGRLARKNYNQNNIEIYSYDSIVYNAQDKISNVYHGELRDHSIPWKQNISWNADDNIVSMQQITTQEGSNIPDTVFMTYTYDNKVNYASQMPEFFIFGGLEPALNLSKNNITTEDRQHGSELKSTTYTYTYDADGYPLSRLEKYVIKNNGTIVSEGADTLRLRYKPE